MPDKLSGGPRFGGDLSGFGAGLARGPNLRSRLIAISRPRFSPAALFAAGEQGAWYDPSDLTTLFQDTDGNVPVTAAGQTVALVLDKSGRGNHATQSVSTRQPIYRVDDNGRPYLEFDGVDDSLATASMNFGGTTISLVAVRQEGGTIWAHLWRALVPASGFWAVGQQGSAVAPNSNFVGGVGSPNYRVNARPLSPVTRGEIYTRTFSLAAIVTTQNLTLPANPLAISGYTGAFLNGRLYGVILRGAATGAADIAAAEAWLAAKSGVTL
jgi:hypothetical protein